MVTLFLHPAQAEEEAASTDRKSVSNHEDCGVGSTERFMSVWKAG
jgi:hypothetical protein